MPTFEITAPDGRVFQVDGPGNAQDALKQVQMQVTGSALPQTLSVAGMDTGIPLPQSVAAGLVGAGRSTQRIIQGVQQLFGGGPPQAQVDEESRLYAPLAAAHPIATGLGEAAPAAAVPVGGSATLLGGILRSALAGAVPGALEYGSPEERAKAAGLGAAGGAVGGIAGGLLGKTLTPFGSANPLATDEARALAQQAGLQLTPAQATGSKVLSSLDGTLATFPGSAGLMAKIQQGQREGFNKAAMLTMGEPATASIAQDAAQIAGQNIGGRIADAAQGAAVKLNTDELVNSLGAVEQKYMRNLASDQKPFVSNAIDDILTAATKGDGTVPGDVYQAWRSRLGARAQGTSDSEFKGAIKGIQGALDDAFSASVGGAGSAAMQAARGQYRNFKTLEPLLQKAGMSNEDISPAQVMTRAIASGNTSPAMMNLATLGQAIGKDYANSGTAPRLFWQDIFRNPLQLANPFPMTAYAIAKAMHNPVGSAYLTNELVGPELLQALTRGGGLLGYGAQNALSPR